MPRRRTRKQEHAALLRVHRKHYAAILAFQGGGCGICGKAPNPERRHALDHDHKAMVLRGVLCTGCNMRLSTRITPEWLRAAAEYLENPPCKRMGALLQT